MFIRKEQAGSAPGHTWEKDGDVIEVADHIAWQLLNIPNGGFSETEPPVPAPEPADEPETPQDVDPVRKKGGRPRLPRDEHGNIIREEADGEPSEPESE